MPYDTEFAKKVDTINSKEPNEKKAIQAAALQIMHRLEESAYPLDPEARSKSQPIHNDE
jgi:hypothetical protein